MLYIYSIKSLPWVVVWRNRQQQTEQQQQQHFLFKRKRRAQPIFFGVLPRASIMFRYNNIYILSQNIVENRYRKKKESRQLTQRLTFTRARHGASDSRQPRPGHWGAPPRDSITQRLQKKKQQTMGQ